VLASPHPPPSASSPSSLLGGEGGVKCLRREDLANRLIVEPLVEGLSMAMARVTAISSVLQAIMKESPIVFTTYAFSRRAQPSMMGAGHIAEGKGRNCDG